MRAGTIQSTTPLSRETTLGDTLWAIIFFAIYYVYDQGLLDDFISDFETGYTIGSKNINELSCQEDIKKMAEGKELKNAFGLTFSIIKVKNITELSKSEKSITCLGDAMFDNAVESKLLMKVFEDTDGQIMYQFEQQ